MPLGNITAPGNAKISPMPTIQETLERLARSRFRGRFRLSPQDREYALRQGREVIAAHAADFVRQRLAPASPPADGRQTPWRGHPVFTAQHACACCCRKCLNRWYRVPLGTEIPEDKQERLVRLLMAWLDRQLGDPAGKW